MKTHRLNRTLLITTVLLISFSLMLSACGKKDTQTTDKQADDKKVTTQNGDVKQETPQNKDVKKDSLQMIPLKMETNNNKDIKVDNTIAVSVINLPTVQCDQCKKNLTKAFKKAVGVNDFDININAKVVKVRYDKSKTDLAKLENVVTAAGYDANDKKADKDAYDNLDDCCKLPKDRK